jgi:hypothetical protein
MRLPTAQSLSARFSAHLATDLALFYLAVKLHCKGTRHGHRRRVEGGELLLVHTEPAFHTAAARGLQLIKLDEPVHDVSLTKQTILLLELSVRR